MAEKKPKKKITKTKKVSKKNEIKEESKSAFESKRHLMVPKHELLPEKWVNELLDQFNITKAQLPSILISDPALKGEDVKNGDVIKITRENTVTGTSYAYRVITTL
jgi:DNA-directed RNA polymerase subunit H